jgi:predicted kinase
MGTVRLAVMLILLNGPPGVGKSTIAQLYVDGHPLALNLDIDRVRGLLGRWPEQAYQAGLLARELTLSMARTHLRAGHHVIVPQYLGRTTFIEALEQLAHDERAPFREIVLLDSKPNVLRRFAHRTEAPAAQHDPDATKQHLEAAAQLGPDSQVQLAQMYDRLLAIIDQRPHARIITCTEGRPAATYQHLLRQLREP